MLCAKPFRSGTLEFGCGQCLRCRVNRRRIWTARLVLEMQQHEASSFVTLTYDNDHLPSDGSVVPLHLQLFMKRLRYYSGRKLRYYAVGEYGDKSFRPHYHLALFGIGAEDHDNAKSKKRSCECVICRAWTEGIVHCGEVTIESAGYIVSYVLKRMTKANDPRLGARHPEFARMSNRPGIGAWAAGSIADFCTTDVGSRYVAEKGDVPSEIRVNGLTFPVGRYISRRTRESLGHASGCPAHVILQLSYDNLLELRAIGHSGKEELRKRDVKRARVLHQIRNSRKRNDL